jgi:hypothetical protein
MKTMTCTQLGGACDTEFKTETFEQIAEMSKQHGMEMFRENDEAHKKAMDAMKEKMQNLEAMQKWMDEKRAEYDSLPDSP